MTDKSVWDKEIAVPANLIAYVDGAVTAKLPPGTVPTGIERSGASYWARTAKISATDAEGNETAFFIKVHQSELGKNMVSHEYQAMSILHKAIPEMVAEPLGWGSYQDDPDAYFFLCRFHELSDNIPDVADFTRLVAELHKRAASPTGEFGFPLVMYGGKNPQHFPMSKTWEECFSKGMEMLFDLEEEVQGPEEELAQLRKGFFELIIPRLLRPLETEGRTLTPRLVHGDLWDGNASVDVNTGGPMIFDALPLYAHNEYELAPWWCVRHKMKDDYINGYLKHFPRSEPADDFGDRGLAYALRFDMLSSSLYPGNLRFRNLCKDSMRRLIAKYPLGYEGYLKEKQLDANAVNIDTFDSIVEVQVPAVPEVVVDHPVIAPAITTIDGNAEVQVQAVPEAVVEPPVVAPVMNAVAFDRNAEVQVPAVSEAVVEPLVVAPVISAVDAFDRNAEVQALAVPEAVVSPPVVTLVMSAAVSAEQPLAVSEAHEA